MKITPLVLPERIKTKIHQTSTCWLWTGAKTSQLRGGILFDGKTQSAHRVIWQLKNGPIPDGLQVLHKCDVPHCVNPDHLFLGTHCDNMRDMVSKGRQSKGESRLHHKLSESDVINIRILDIPQRQLGLLYEVTAGAISHIKTRRTWAHLPLILLFAISLLAGCQTFPTLTHPRAGGDYSFWSEMPYYNPYRPFYPDGYYTEPAGISRNDLIIAAEGGFQ